jgi:hypothetical protein
LLASSSSSISVNRPLLASRMMPSAAADADDAYAASFFSD